MDLNEKDIDGTLLLRYINETSSSEERKQVDLWLSEDAANNDVLLQAARIYHAQQTRKRINQRDVTRALNKIHKRIGRRTQRIFLMRMAVAASLILGVWGVGSLLWQNTKTEDHPQYTPQMISVTANAGTRSQITLPDGTQVWLNAGSTVVYPSHFCASSNNRNVKNERRVILSGEACFEVVQNTDQPFVVSAADDKMNIRVTGTKFIVQAYENDELAHITLIEGSVAVIVEGKMDEIPLTHSEKLTYNTLNGSTVKQNIDIAQASAWMEGRLIFKNTPMTEVLRQLKIFYDVEFEVSNTTILGYTFTGTFSNRPLSQILEYMKITSKINNKIVFPENQEEKPVVVLNL